MLDLGRPPLPCLPECPRPRATLSGAGSAPLPGPANAHLPPGRLLSPVKAGKAPPPALAAKHPGSFPGPGPGWGEVPPGWEAHLHPALRDDQPPSTRAASPDRAGGEGGRPAAVARVPRPPLLNLARAASLLLRQDTTPLIYRSGTFSQPYSSVLDFFQHQFQGTGQGGARSRERCQVGPQLHPQPQ